MPTSIDELIERLETNQQVPHGLFCNVAEFIDSRFGVDKELVEELLEGSSEGWLDDCRELHQILFSDWLVTMGQCNLSGHATIIPDYNGPNGERLKQQWPEDQWHEGISCDLEVGDGWERMTRAWLICLLKGIRYLLRSRLDS